MASSNEENDAGDVQRITLYRLLPLAYRLYSWPFASLYILWGLTWAHAEGKMTANLIAGLLVLATSHLLLFLLSFWSVSADVWMKATKVTGVEQADIVKVEPFEGVGFVEVVDLHRDKLWVEATGREEPHLWFMYQKAKYVYDIATKSFKPLSFPVDKQLSAYMDTAGLDGPADVESRIQLYGTNRFDLPMPTFWEMFQEQAVAPFFVFQVFCVLLWCLDDYLIYSLATLVMLVLFECTVVYARMRNMQTLFSMLRAPEPIMVHRAGKWEVVLSSLLVPGDLVAIGHSTLIPCDMLLTSGTCIVNEAILTGESTPTHKEAPDPDELNTCLDISHHTRHILFGGTYLVDNRHDQSHHSGPEAPGTTCLAVVLQTGFHTKQGRLLRTIVFGSQRMTANNAESLSIIAFLLAWALVAAAIVWHIGTVRGRDRWKLLLDCLLIITSVVPPELPMELSLAVNNSLLALQKLAIFCTEPFRIPFAGKVDVCCFDKTGTLTSEHLQVDGLVLLGPHGQQLVKVSEASREARIVLGGCHSLAVVTRDEQGGKLTRGRVLGDQLEMAMVEAANGIVYPNDTVALQADKGVMLNILRRFHFTSALKRMSTVTLVKMATGHPSCLVLSKGAPEVMAGLYATLPDGYHEATLHYARKGYRVLAMGYKQLNLTQVQQISRDSAERNLIFGGFLLVSCPLRRDSRAAVIALRHSSHRVIMITGDNPLTACHVAQATTIIREHHQPFILSKAKSDSKDIDWTWTHIDGVLDVPLDDPDALKILRQNRARLCVTGEGYAHLQASGKWALFAGLIVVYARMAPEQKDAVVTALRKRGHVVSMCGDGTNDMGALKQSQVGIALLDTPGGRWGKKSSRKSTANTPAAIMEEGAMGEAPVVKFGDVSMASPFTSRVPTVMSVVNIVRQGRCTLVTTLQMNTVLVLNSLVNAFCLSVLSVYSVKFSDGQYTAEGFYLAALFMFLSRSKPLKTLSKARPLPDVCCKFFVITVMGQFFLHVVTLMLTIYWAKTSLPEPFEPPPLDADFAPSLVNTAVYVAGLHIISVNFLVNCKGQPFMEGVDGNWLLAGTLTAMLVAVGVLVLGLSPALSESLEVVLFPEEIMWPQLGILVADSLGAFLWDRFWRKRLGYASIQPL